MPDGLLVIGFVIGLGLIVLGGAALGPSASSPLAGLFGDRRGRDWPTGVQEGDVPRFRFPPERTADRAPSSEDGDPGATPATRRERLHAEIHPARPKR